jgi:hypothetical protein
MSRAQYLKTLEREVNAATRIIDELTKENYELRQMLQTSSTPLRSTNEAQPTKSKADMEWAKEAVKDVFFGCVLNITLKTGGVCTKYLYEMSEVEVLDYLQLITDLFDVKKKNN